MSSDNWRVRLTVPAENRHLHIVRLTTAGAAAEAGLDAAEIEDAKIAVDELCSVSIAGAHADAALSIEFVATDGGLTVETSCPADNEPSLDELAQAILDATVDTLEFDHGSLGGGFRFTKLHRVV